MIPSPRLDILLYAHDGRGLGHAGRTIAVGMALRRLFPEYRILFLSGCTMSRELIGTSPLDWLKLPSYETVVEGGKSRGIAGKSNYSDQDLGKLRARQIAEIIMNYRPRIVLVDHTPQGKHKELIPALEASRAGNINWVLGVRGVVGNVDQLGGTLAPTLFDQYYSSLLWYGDSKVLGNEALYELGCRYTTTPVECGYVSRIAEYGPPRPAPEEKEFAGTISIPWFGESTPAFLECLYSVLKQFGDRYGGWKLFLDNSHPRSAALHSLFESLPNCTVEEPNQRYIDSLRRSRCALIYGGYNSLMDVLSMNLPTLVILREMQDEEQQQHLDKLMKFEANPFRTLTEQCDKETLTATLEKIVTNSPPVAAALNLNGAVNAAKHLGAMLD